MDSNEKVLKEILKGKRILVTGGAGSIGKEIVKRLLRYDVKQIRILDIRENAQFHLSNELTSDKLRFLIGDVRDKPRLSIACNSIDIIFHTAALKHVPLCEYNPFEAVKTNIVGTQNLIECAIENEVEKVILISTDKAVNPVSTMGASKLMAERQFIATNSFSGTKTKFSVVRFGNVLGSEGSLIDMIQKLDGTEIGITDERMTRFVMSMGDSINFILKSLLIMRGNELFILKMPAIKIIDLLNVYAAKRGLKINKIGVRQGEKIFEELMTDDESKFALELPDMYILTLDATALERKYYGNATKAKYAKYTSESTAQLKPRELEELLVKNGLI